MPDLHIDMFLFLLKWGCELEYARRRGTLRDACVAERPMYAPSANIIRLYVSYGETTKRHVGATAKIGAALRLGF